MGTIIQAEIPPDEFALAETLDACPDATVECEQLVDLPDERVMPLVWVRTPAPETFETALAKDDTVGTYTQLAGTGTEWLYEMNWSDNIQLILRMLTTEGAVILNTRGSADGWYLRVLFPDRDNVRETIDFCASHNLSIKIHSIRHIGDEDADQGSIRAGLTAAQHEALSLAYQRGYFAVPRMVDLEELADEMGVTHQALSERLRRGHATLIGETLLNETTPPSADPPADVTAHGDLESIDY